MDSKEQKFTELIVPMQGMLRYVKSDKGEYIRFDMVDGSSLILRPGRDGFFDENFDQAKKYALSMKRLLGFLEERAKNSGG